MRIGNVEFEFKSNSDKNGFWLTAPDNQPHNVTPVVIGIFAVLLVAFCCGAVVF